MQLLAGIQKYFKVHEFFERRFSNNFSNVLIFTCVIADILLYLTRLDSAQMVKFSRRTRSQSAFSVLCGIGPWRGTGVHNVPRSAWVKTTLPACVSQQESRLPFLLAASVFIHALRGTFCSSCIPPL
jgi:hypothetical protein